MRIIEIESIVKFFAIALIVLSSVASLAVLGIYAYEENFSDAAYARKVKEIYNDLWTQTGQAQERIPLGIVDSAEINAYNDGSKIVIYTGLINSTDSWDEVALVLGHEIAHGTLWHLKMIGEWNVAKTELESSVLEANADKLGAVYMMKAGYSICKGREIFKSWLKERGDYQGGGHPGFAYRYSQLNIGCGK